MRFLILLGALILSISPSNSQPKGNKYFGFELGGDVFDTDINNKELFRLDRSYYLSLYGQSPERLRGTLYRSYLGVKFEKVILSNSIAIGAGLRFELTYSDIKPFYSFFESEGPGYVFFLIQQNENSSHFIRINKIRFLGYSLSIPIDIKYFPFEEHFFRPYLVGCFENSFRIGKDETVKFANSELNIYESEVFQTFDNPQVYFSRLSGGVGFKLGREESKINIHLELKIPAYLTKDQSSLVDHSLGVQLQAGFLVKLNNTQ